MAIRVLLVDDHVLLRQALCLILSGERAIEVVGELGDGVMVEETVTLLAPDVVLMDISMPGVNGVDATRSLLRNQPAQRVLVLSSYNSKKLVAELLQMGARGYVLKSTSADELIGAIKQVANGGIYCSPGLEADLERDEIGSRAPHALGQREKEVLSLLALGKSSPQIALELQIAASTVDVHRRNIMGKLDLHSVAELTHYAVRTGMISI